jgi:DNA-binding NtrC family response regulator/tetratricopeptide (TPR) repeat protein
MRSNERFPDSLSELIGDSPDMIALGRQVRQLLRSAAVAPRLPSVLVLGETGSGKGLLARAIHGAGPRAHGSFIDVNCAAIPEQLLEAELFGYEKGAFTDARQAKPGLFQLAHQGTLFLDEIGLLALPLQSKLLAALEGRAVRRLGSTQIEPAEVWVIAATNEDLQAAVSEHRFRPDLYHRLAVITLHLPPLRQRGGDVVTLAEHFLRRTCEDYRLPSKTLSADAREALTAYAWPGNVRELSNLIERVALLSDGPVISSAALGLASAPPGVPRSRASASPFAPEGAGEDLRAALAETDGNISRTAAKLGISRNTVKARMARYGLAPRVGARRAPHPLSAPAPSSRRKGQSWPTGLAEGSDWSTPVAELPPATPLPAARTGIRHELRQVGVLRVDFGSRDGLSQTGRVVDEVLDKIQSFGGRLEELGDTMVIAAFGVDHAVEDAAIRAALAGLAIRHMADRGHANPRLAGLRGAVHAATASIRQAREAAVIDLADKRAMLAALDALVGTAPLGSITASDSAAPLLRRRFAQTPLPMPLNGGPRVYTISGIEGTRFRPGGRMATFAGRVAELHLLERRLALAAQGRGQIVSVVGEPGIGKSRLLYEFRQTLAGTDIAYLEAQCVSYGTGAPFLPIMDLLRSACGVAEADAPDVVAEKVYRRLARLDVDAEKSAPFLTHLLGGATGQRLAGLSPEVVSARTLQAFVTTMLALSRQKPLVVVMEDLHWIDRSSEAYLAALAERIAGARILLLVTYRPADRPAFAEYRDATKIGLPPLTPDEVASIARSVLGDAVSDSAAQLIATRAGGNPLFAEELTMALVDGGAGGAAVIEPDGPLAPASRIDRIPTSPSPIDEGLRALVETEVLLGERAPRHVRLAPPATQVPATLQALLAARIGRLAPDDRALLLTAAVIGKDVPYRLLGAVADRPEAELRRGLQHLQAAEFLYEASLVPDLEYTFRHALTHDVAYASLLPEPRRALHARIVHTIEALGSNRSPEQVERLADHALQGEVWDKALTYLREAGAAALSRVAYPEAAVRFEQALIALSHLPRTRETLAQALLLRFDLRHALFPLGQPERGLHYLREAEDLAQTLEDRRSLGWVSAYMCYYLLPKDLAESLTCAERARAIAEQFGDGPLHVAASYYVGLACHNAGEYRRGARAFTSAIRLLDGGLGHERCGLICLPVSVTRSWLAICLAHLGEFDGALAASQEGLRLAEEADHSYTVIIACRNLAVVHALRGRLAEAAALLDRALVLAREGKFSDLIPGVTARLGWVWVRSGRVREGLSLLAEGVTVNESTGGRGSHSLLLTYLGEGYARAGRHDDALECARQALTHAREHGERGDEAWTLRLWGEIAARRHPPDIDSARAHFRQALALAEELGMRPLMMHCHVGLGALGQGVGEPRRAEEHLAAALALAREMDLPWPPPESGGAVATPS